MRPDVASFLEHFGAPGQSLDSERRQECWAETFLSLDPTRAVPVDRAARRRERASPRKVS